MLKIKQKNEIKKQVYGSNTNDIRRGSEQHHAMHALTFFLFMIRRALKGEPVKRELLARILHHLMDLREFLENDALNRLVNALIAGVRSEYNRRANPMTMRAWLVQNQDQVMRLARYYQREEIFKDMKGLRHA